MADLHRHDNRLEELIATIPNDSLSARTADTFSLLSDSTRLKIFWLLCHCEECVCDIAAAVKMSPPAVSHHLRLLKQSGLIESRRAGKEVLYSLSEGIEARLLHEAVDSLLSNKCPLDQ